MPVVNENDVVAAPRLFFTGNDVLADLAASELHALMRVIINQIPPVYVKGLIGSISETRYLCDVQTYWVSQTFRIRPKQNLSNKTYRLSVYNYIEAFSILLSIF